MASIKDLKTRIGTVKNTQQITKAMKMVSAAKLRRAQDAITSQRPYAQRLGDLMKLLASMPDADVSSPLLSREESAEATGPRRVLLVLVTSDRGLAGAFNGNIAKAAQRWIAANQDRYDVIELGFVGRKGYDFFKNRKVTLGPYYSELGGKVTFVKAKKLADDLTSRFINGKTDEVKIIYNEFKNAVTQKVVVQDFLPLSKDSLGSDSGAADAASTPAIIVKPDARSVLESLLSKHFSTQTFKIMLESQAGEHGARMSAMENATKNAGEMMKKLTLQYNKQRQAGITKELLEIISGSESQKAS